MTCLTSVLICMCEQCGYGRADHPKTMGKPWVAGVRPQHCEGCGSPKWDESTKSRAQIALRVKSRVDPILYALGFRRMPPSLTKKLPRVGLSNSTGSWGSRVDLAKQPIGRD